MSQLGQGLGLSPQRLRGDKAREVKRLSPREHVIHSAAQLMGEHGQGFGFAVFVFEFRKIGFARRTLADKQHSGFRKGPTSMDVADLFAGGAKSFPIGFLGTLHEPTIGDEILHAGKAANVVDLV